MNRHFSQDNMQTAHGYVERSSKPLIIKEMHIRATVRYRRTHVRMAITKKTGSTCWRGGRDKGTRVHRQWDCKCVQPL